MLKRFMSFLTAIALSGVFLLSTLPQADAGSRKGRFIAGVAVGVGAAVLFKKLKKNRSRKRRASRKRSKKRYATRSKKRRVTSSRRSVASKRRASGVDLTQAQTALAALGLYTIAIDGKSGPSTRAAVSDFQQQSGHAVTGILTRDQYNQLIAVNSVGDSDATQTAVGSTSFAYADDGLDATDEQLDAQLDQYDNDGNAQVDILALPNSEGGLEQPAVQGETIVLSSATTSVNEAPLENIGDPDAVPELVLPN